MTDSTGPYEPVAVDETTPATNKLVSLLRRKKTMGLAEAQFGQSLDQLASSDDPAKLIPDQKKIVVTENDMRESQRPG